MFALDFEQSLTRCSYAVRLITILKKSPGPFQGGAVERNQIGSRVFGFWDVEGKNRVDVAGPSAVSLPEIPT